jgi:hypothetical protein
MNGIFQFIAILMFCVLYLFNPSKIWIFWIAINCLIGICFTLKV